MSVAADTVCERPPRVQPRLIKERGVTVDKALMTAPAGWYPDPHAPHINRWWDGQAWTAQTSAPAAAVATLSNPYAVAPSTPPTRRGPVIAIVVVAIVATIAVVAAIPVALQKSQHPACGTYATAGMSSEAKAYVRVVHDFYRRSQAYTEHVNAQGGGHLATASDYRAELEIETAFVAGVESTTFTGQAATDAQEVIAESERTIQDLNLALTRPGPDVDARLKLDYDNESSAQLRTDLGLTPRGTCSFWQPT